MIKQDEECCVAARVCVGDENGVKKREKTQWKHIGISTSLLYVCWFRDESSFHKK